MQEFDKAALQKGTGRQKRRKEGAVEGRVGCPAGTPNLQTEQPGYGAGLEIARSEVCWETVHPAPAANTASVPGALLLREKEYVGRTKEASPAAAPHPRVHFPCCGC